MKVICKYDKNLEQFLRKVVDYVINTLAINLDLSDLEEIELIKRCSIETDGRAYNEGRNIFVTSRLYELLPTLSLDDLVDNAHFKKLVNVIYHEMGHINDWKKMPNLYRIASHMGETEVNLKDTSCFFWLEYLAEKRTYVPEDNYNEFCEPFSKKKWEITHFNLCDANGSNFFFLQKCLSYFIVRTQSSNWKEYYFHMMNNTLLPPLITELDGELKRLETLLPFDDPIFLEQLYNIFKKYYQRFIAQSLSKKEKLFHA